MYKIPYINIIISKTKANLITWVLVTSSNAKKTGWN